MGQGTATWLLPGGASKGQFTQSRISRWSICRTTNNCQISKNLKEGLGLIVPEAGKELGSDPQALTRAACLYGKAHLPTSKTLTSVVRSESETVNREEVTFTLAAKQLQDAALAKPSSENKTKQNKFSGIP